MTIMSQPFTEDVMTAVTLYGTTYEPDKDGVVTIPTTEGNCVCRIVSEELKRKDWYYRIEYKGNGYIQVSRSHFEQALSLIVHEGELI